MEMEKFDMSIDTYTLGIAWFYIGLFLLFVLAGIVEIWHRIRKGR